MKGLLRKDIAYMKPLQTAGLLLASSFIFLISDMPLALSYIVLLGTAFSQVSFTYDEQNGGMRYILSLPVTRAQYVQSKYVFLLGAQLCMLAIGMVLRLWVRHEGAFLPWAGLGIACYLAVTALYIPLMLILNKNREILGTISAMLPFILVIVRKKMGKINVPTVYNGEYLLPLLIGSLVLLILSYHISLRIIEKKEY